jgi:pyruvate dehydrogenase E2 component (dihydrolipoamide acetyltransferase)
MAETVTMPKLGFDMAEGTLVRWVKNLGDPVAKGEILAEIETDKATVEVESTFSGVLAKTLVDQGAVVPVGNPIAVIAAPDETIDESQGETPASTPTQAPEPKTSPEITPKPEVVAEAKQLVGQEEPPAQQGSPEPAPSGEFHASPLARRMAREQGLDLSQIQGTGPGGRITRKDIESAQKPQPAVTPAAQQAAQPTVSPIAPLPAIAWTPGAPSLKDENIPLERLRSVVGKRMVESKQQAPHFYVTHVFTVNALMDVRKQINAALPEGEKISINDMIVKAVAITLLSFPNMNAALQGNQVHRFGHVNIGSAVSVPGGLMTVVSRDADQKPLRVISSELREMAARARSGKVKPQDIEGSTFSISNLGMYAVDEFQAIINPPEAAILAVGSAKQEPVVMNGELAIAWQMKATISVDHRVSDGAEGAQFLQVLDEVLQNPLRLLL